MLYLTEDDKANFYYNIPIAHTTSILLGTGTSITQAAIVDDNSHQTHQQKATLFFRLNINICLFSVYFLFVMS